MSTYPGKDRSSGDQSNLSLSGEGSEHVSQNTALSTESSVAEPTPAALRPQKFRKIGAGTCGRVYHEAGTSHVLKRAITDDYVKQLWNDYGVHLRVSKAFKSVQGMEIDIHVPRVFFHIGPDDVKWWASNESRFPESEQYAPRTALVTERILPLIELIRRSITKLYCKPNLQEPVLKDPNNRDCLARVYLGSRRADPARKLAFFTLRNFKLHVDMFEELKLAAEPYAVSMAQSLAVMHWKIGCDARDVEFVLGSAPARTEESQEMTEAEFSTYAISATTRPGFVDFKHRTVHLWLLDFNQVQSITMDTAGVKQAVKAFMDNDPYFPRPLAAHPADQKLWSSFKNTYLDTSRRLLLHKEIDDGVEVPWKSLPQTFVEELVEAEQARLTEKARAAKTV